MATRKTRPKESPTPAQAASAPPSGALRVPPVATGVARGVTVIRCVDEVAAIDLLSRPDFAATILGRLDERHLLVDPGKEEAFANAAIKHKVAIARATGKP